MENHQLAWCSILDPLLLLSGRTFALNEEYIAGWLSFFPAPHLTPYEGIHSVPPSCVVRLTKGKKRISKYWALDPSKRIRRRGDPEYEERFRRVFAHAVRRRLRSDDPILAELERGIEFYHPVVMRHGRELIYHGPSQEPEAGYRFLFDDFRSRLERRRPYFNQDWEKRSRHGCHIDVSYLPSLDFERVTHIVLLSIPSLLAGSEHASASNLPAA